MGGSGHTGSAVADGRDESPTPASPTPPALTPASHPDVGRLLSLALVDGAGTGAHNVLSTVLVARRHGLLAAGVVAIAALGRLVGMTVIRRCELAGLSPAQLRRVFGALVWVMVLSSMATIAAAAFAPVWVTLGCALVWSAANSASSTLAVSAMPGEVVRFGPWSMAGQAAGAVLAGLALGLPTGWVVATGVAIQAGQLLEPMLARPWTFPEIHGVALHEIMHSMGRGLTTALLSYGPLALYGALAVQVAGRLWVGPAMIAYAVGALTAGRVDARLPCWRHWPSVLVLAAIGVGAWSLALGPVGLLAARAVMGCALFVAQGRLMRTALDAPGERVATTTLAATATGLGLGSGLAAPGVAALVERFGVSGMGLTLAVACLVVAGGVTVVQRLRRPAVVAAS